MTRSMRIAHVTATFPPYWAGTGNVAYHNARLMHERGHEVTVFTAATPRDHEMTFPFPVERLPAAFRLGNAPFTPALARRLRGFDIIHLHYPFIFGAELTMWAAWRAGTTLVFSYHNQLQERRPLKRALFALYNLLVEPLLFRQAAHIVAVRKGHFLALHPRFANDPRLVEVPNGVDTDAFAPSDRRAARAALGWPADAPTALFVGALDQAHRFKYVDGLLRAFARVTVPDARLVIVGDGDLRPGLERLAGELGVRGRVAFLGRRAPEALPPIYGAADVSVLPSTGVESFGVVLIESMACGTPPIVADLPGVREAVAPDVDGLLVPPGDGAALTKALERALADVAATRAMGERGRAKVVRQYDWCVIGDRIEGLYATARVQAVPA